MKYSVDPGQLSSCFISFASLNLGSEMNIENWETLQNETDWSFTVSMVLACV